MMMMMMAAKKRVYFRLQSPDAGAVSVLGSFNGWKEARALKRGKSGSWSTWMNLESGRHEYRFLVDGSWANDPNCRKRVPNSYGTENDVCEV